MISGVLKVRLRQKCLTLHNDLIKTGNKEGLFLKYESAEETFTFFIQNNNFPAQINLDEKTETGHISHRLPLWWLSSDHGLFQWWSMWKKTKGKPTQHWHAVQRQAPHHFCHEHQCLQINWVDATLTWPFKVAGRGFSERPKWEQVERWQKKESPSSTWHRHHALLIWPKFSF